VAKKQKIVIFTGAGSSVQFDNPATKEFKDLLINTNDQNVRVLDLLLKFPEFSDIEHVLECIKNSKDNIKSSTYFTNN